MRHTNCRWKSKRRAIFACNSSQVLGPPEAAADTFAVSRVLALTASANVISRRLLERASFVRVRESVMLFQGHEQMVSRYVCLKPRMPWDS